VRTGRDGLGYDVDFEALSLYLSAEVEARLRAEAVKRDLSPEELAARSIEEYIPAETTRPPKHRLTFTGMGASTSGRHAREDEEMLAEGFGRDSLR
jgi:predicted transcriptional regulator